jgi:DNA-binding SARP family transcriptional activator
VRERTYRLVLRDGDRVDVDRFETAALAALAIHGPTRARALERAAALWTGEPLPEDRYEDWCLAWRERIGDVRAELLGALAKARAAAGDWPGAAAAARDLVDTDPLDEASHRLLMTAYARAGMRDRALRQFVDCRRALVDELGVEPAAQTAKLQRRILDGEPV